MSITIFTATGCARCRIVKEFMKNENIPFTEKDIKGEGKEEFQNFYKVNRKAIIRGSEGIEFPILVENGEIRQGIGAVMAFLLAGRKLDGFFTVGSLHQEWVDGIHVSGGDPRYKEDFIQVLRLLKSKNLNLQMDTNGKNSVVLKQVLTENLAQMVIMDIWPKRLYAQLLGEDMNINYIEESIALIPQFSEYKFQTTILPIQRENGEISFLTPEEIMETAKYIYEVTGSKKNKYFIKPANSQDIESDIFKSLEPLTNNQLLVYRTKARVYQVYAEIGKQS